MTTLAGTLVLRDVNDVEALVRKVADDRLRSWGARLQRFDHEDLVTYLIGVAWELSGRYDPAKDKNPNFGAYAAKILTLRVADWYRQRFGDTRHGDRPVVLSLDAPASLGSFGGESAEGTDAGRGRLVDTLTSSEGDPAVDRAPDLVGSLQRRGGGGARSIEALGEPPARRAARGNGSNTPPLKKPRITPTKRRNDAPPNCSACTPTFRSAFGRVNKRLPVDQRLSDAELDAKALKRGQAVKFAGEWICPRCTTLPIPGGTILLFDQVYPNRASRRADRGATKVLSGARRGTGKLKKGAT